MQKPATIESAESIDTIDTTDTTLAEAKVPFFTIAGEATEVVTRGRHDPCVGVRAGITLESRMAIEVMNAILMHAARRPNPDDFRLFPPTTDR